VSKSGHWVGVDEPGDGERDGCAGDYLITIVEKGSSPKFASRTLHCYGPILGEGILLYWAEGFVPNGI
jgi:hypothetical protein